MLNKDVNVDGIMYVNLCFILVTNNPAAALAFIPVKMIYPPPKTKLMAAANTENRIKSELKRAIQASNMYKIVCK